MLYLGVISLLPDVFASLAYGVTGRAIEQGLAKVDYWSPREWANRPYRQIDDKPYGGGPGMVMMYEPLHAAIQHAKSQMPSTCKTIYLSPQGKKQKQQDLHEHSIQYKRIIFVCGRYEGIDIRVTDFYRSAQNFKVREVSIGDYVLNGGEVATLVIMEAIIRLIPGVIGNPASLDEESHTLEGSEGILVEYPNYTKPQEWRGLKVPEVLLSGNHGLIAEYRREQAKLRTQNLGK